MALGAIISGTISESWLGVPILATDRVIGVVALESLRPAAFDEADERLLGTLAASLGVALENARLFDETRRLLAETDQRAAELAVVNEIGLALAKQLDFQSIIELVGERVRTILSASTLYIAIHDLETNLIRFPYAVEDDARDLSTQEFPFGEGITSIVIKSGRPLRLGRAEADALGAHWTRSYLGVPIWGGERVLGVIVAAGRRGPTRRTSVAATSSSMGVALENARLFDGRAPWPRRTSGRLSWRSSPVSGGPRGGSTCVDVRPVGDKVARSSTPRSSTSDLPRRRPDALPHDRRGVSSLTADLAPRRRSGRIGIDRDPSARAETRQPLLVNTLTQFARLVKRLPDRRPSRSTLWAPLVVGDESRGHLLQNLDRENVQRLRRPPVEHAAASLGVSLERPAVR
jgi:GAF domain-containing protein